MTNMKKSDKKKKYDNLKKEKENQINDLKEEKIKDEINKLEKVEKYKNEKKIVVGKLMMSYKESLFKGKNVKKEGLVWIIKTIL